MLILTIDAALGRCSAALVEDEVLLIERSEDGARSHAALAPLVGAVCAVHGARIALIAVTIGPGSFTGLRAAIAIAHGVALGAGTAVVGVTVGEALRAGLASTPRELWVAIDSRRDRIFLDRADRIMALAPQDVPLPDAPVALAGDAAAALAERLTSRGADVLLTGARLPQPRDIARVARLRAAGLLPDRKLIPLYVDPPEARPVAQRPPPGEPIG